LIGWRSEAILSKAELHPLEILGREQVPPVQEQRAYFGIPEWLTSYRKDWFRPDIIAGLTAAAVVIPKSMAYTSVAGLPLQVGLYTAFLPMIIYAFLGTSRVLSVSTTSTIAILAATSLDEAVPNGDASSLVPAAATLTLLVGVMLVLGCFLRLGFVANFISEPVLIGFKAGIGSSSTRSRSCSAPISPRQGSCTTFCRRSAVFPKQI
jgi:MFS superfamily sulfate permease-like transporter